MTALTPQEASEEWLCPFARTFAAKEAQHSCRGDICALWRWQPIAADHPAFTAAYAKVKVEMPNAIHATRMKHIMENREALGIPTKPERGWCGAGGQP